ncbi:3-hydroxyacyl-CoA dehydrogenase [Nocardia cyriacigeorgica]|uniref:3-hydroxyacyl-CoA dehydrogenase n=1 Tax=Nocardia cyriacigeorgica TaxID=135487 RepID=UPI0024547357|nr:3-hydroxyacyl-CoA dehydrogenase [Nocardia cyriacigeorgica]
MVGARAGDRCPSGKGRAMTATIGKVTVLGTGVLGSQIAFQTAYSGFDVVAYDIDDAALEKAASRFDELVQTYRQEVAGAADGKAEAARSRIRLTADLADAAGEADLIIEAIPEVLKIKVDTYTELGKLAPPATIFATNSSTLLPSDMKDATGRPDRFLALHFANRVWAFNTAEVMGTADTDPEVFRTVVQFAKDIGMVPIELHKEKAGYVLNSLLVPFLNAAGELVADGYAEPETVDKTWKIATGAPMGPFQIFDIIGLTTPYNISVHGDAAAQRFAAFLKENYIDKGKLGVATGEGFYKYPSE